MIALTRYAYGHNEFPHSKRGADHALYLISDLVDVEAFDLSVADSGDRRTHWDYGEQRLVNGDYEYLNHAKAGFDGVPVVVIVSRPTLEDGWMFIGMSNGAVLLWKAPVGPNSAVLGSRMTPDGFLVADLTLYHQWVRFYNDDTVCHGSFEKENGNTCSECGDWTICYEYRRSRLSRRIMTSRTSVITDIVRTDEIGQITGVLVQRELEFWLV